MVLVKNRPTYVLHHLTECLSCLMHEVMHIAIHVEILSDDGCCGVRSVAII